MFFVVLCARAPENSTGSGSGLKASQEKQYPAYLVKLINYIFCTSSYLAYHSGNIYNIMISVTSLKQT